MAEVHVHECEQFNDKDKGGNPIPGTFHQERYDGQFPGRGVPVARRFDKKTKEWSKPVCPWCGKDTSTDPLATRDQLNYMEGRN